MIDCLVAAPMMGTLCIFGCYHHQKVGAREVVEEIVVADVAAVAVVLAKENYSREQAAVTLSFCVFLSKRMPLA